MAEYKKLGYLNKDFVFFHLNDKKSKQFSYHYHDFHKILFFQKGSVTYHIEGQHYPLKPNDIVLVKAGQIHCPVISSDSEYERMILYVSKDFLSLYEKQGYGLNTCFLKADEKNSCVLRGRLSSIIELLNSLKKIENALLEPGFADELYQKTLFLSFLIELNRMVLRNETEYIDPNAASNQTVIDVSTYILKHLTEDLTIEKISAEFYLNRYYLMHLFKRETGCTLGNYITQKRLLLSSRLLLQGASATESCYGSGFKTYSTFSRAFQKEFHTSPAKLVKKFSHATSK